MNGILQILFSLSISGSLLILTLFLGKPLLKNRISKQWQYYIWLIVIARLLLPLTPETSLIGTLFQQAVLPSAESVSAAVPAEYPAVLPSAPDIFVPDSSVPQPEAVSPAPSSIPAADISEALRQYLWAVWLGTALVLLIRKITVFQSFTKYMKAGRKEVSDVELLDRLAQLCEQTGIRRPVELYVNPLASSPMLLGFFRSCIVLPCADLPDTEFQYTIQHELIHCKRQDLLYKWLVQLTVCLHWFNPLVWLMGREISRACELSCDEAVIAVLSPQERRAYGDTLLHAMEGGGTYQSSVGSVTLHENAELLKERLGAIMNFKKTSQLTTAASFVLAAALLTGAGAAGAYTGAAEQKPAKTLSLTNSSAGNRIYAAHAEECYKGKNIEGFAAALRMLEDDSTLIAYFAEKAYADSQISFFSVLVNYMDQTALEAWTSKAIEDRRANFQSVLMTATGQTEELKKAQAEWDKQKTEEYAAWGITKKGSVYYYQDQLVNIFMDCRPDKSFVQLDMNPLGTVNIKIIRDSSNQIKSVSLMTDAEKSALFGELYDEDEEDWHNCRIIEIPVIQTESAVMDTLDIRGTTYYLVSNEAQLRAIGTGEYSLNGNYMQQADIVLSSAEWVPIGTAEQPFTGSYNGNGFEIKGLTMTNPNAKVVGMFGTAQNAHIYNITLRDYDIARAGSNVKGVSVGAILAVGQGTRSYDNLVYPKQEENSVLNLDAEDLPADVRKTLNSCPARTWCLVHSGGRQYIWHSGFGWSFGYRPEQRDDGWQIDITRFQKKDSGNLLLSLPDGAPVTVTCNGQTVTLTEIS